MSLVPYVPAESREVVLRHGSAVVVFDQHSKQLSLRAASSTSVEPTSCPYCHRPLRDPSAHDPDIHDHVPPSNLETEHGFVNPAYFGMLRRSQPGSTEPSRPSSPTKRLRQIPLPGRESSGSASAAAEMPAPPGTEFVESSPAMPSREGGISAKAFSPNYFKDFFVEDRELGRGGKGVVLLVRHVLDGVPLGQFACKRVPVGDDHEWLEKVLIEVQLLQNLQHQNLVSYRHVWLEDYQISTFGPSVPCAFILQQYCNSGDLHHYVLGGSMGRNAMTPQELKARLRRRSKGQLDVPNELGGPRRMHFEEILSFFKDITSGLNHLHAHGYIHRDLKPSNCLLHDDGKRLTVLVSDFGEVQVVNATRKSTGATGTISYCAPEVLRRQTPNGPLGNFSTKSDIFSLGMIVYFMCFGRLPYVNADGIDEDNEDLELLREEITGWAGFNDEHRARPDLPDILYRPLRRLLSLDPAERPGTEEILQVFKSPSKFDEIGGYAAPSGLEELGSRISLADTPSPAPTKHARKTSKATFVRPGASKLSASLGPSRSPSPVSHTTLSSSPNTTPPESSVMLRPRKSIPDVVALPRPRSLSRPTSPRLMLPPPPPRTLSDRLHHALSHPSLLSLLKIMLFVSKLVSLSSPCFPLAPNPKVAWPLLCLALLDFGIGIDEAGAGYWSSVVLAAVHIGAVLGVVKWGGGLCVSPRWSDI
ncbi:kinase-like protein [Mytilinidion resinicola]|uniref:non-specific serine/threonine protein kinase n=1 Tax=Mytilinidion resinicola TaxID=574789 RepID=A0A6A6Y116_9PEZI|nr:kinase-like protein [Mytilinidion resinicola]KAF2802350.1 kinase-like protein [Mytilinidion resinicola]